MSSGIWKPHGTVSRNLCHQGCFQTRKYFWFPSLLSAPVPLIRETTCWYWSLSYIPDGTALLCRITVYTILLPQSSRNRLVKHKDQIFWGWIFTAWTPVIFRHTIHEPVPLPASDPSAFPMPSHRLRSSGPAAVPLPSSVIIR